MEKIYLTREAYQKIKEDIDFLKTNKRKQLAKEIGEAREKGDISENAEYDAAKEAQALNEKKISELEGKLGRSEILDESRIPKDKISIGSVVKLMDLGCNEEECYTLVSEMEADYAKGKISINSPIGKGLLGFKKDDIVEIKIPAGTLKYKIIEISR
ncbi:MAG: transcription elongation factor GreA [bacterium]|nr:transcription elongation factor GreA [bacterium]MDD5353850.1 transcription elongation factor GreA [bacterium]MDD5757423.1 transcription elongation factor GreA [bacterium]